MEGWKRRLSTSGGCPLSELRLRLGHPRCAPAHPGPRRSPGARPRLRSSAATLPTWPSTLPSPAPRKGSRSPGRAATAWGRARRNLWVAKAREVVCSQVEQMKGFGGRRCRSRSKGGSGWIREPRGLRVGFTYPLPAPRPAHCFQIRRTALCGCPRGPFPPQPSAGSLRGQGSPGDSWG